MAKRLAKQILILIGCFLVVGPIRQPLAQQNMAAVAGVVDVAGAVRLYFARNGKYLAWPSLLPDPEISEILTDTGGTPGTVMVECFKNLTVRGGHGALLP